MSYISSKQRVLWTLIIILATSLSTLAQVQTVNLDFYHKNGDGTYVRATNPEIGHRSLSPLLAAEYVLTPDTELYFTINGSVVQDSTLVLELYGRREAIWFEADPNDPQPPIAQAVESFGKVEIPFTTTSINNGTVHEVAFGDLVDGQALLNGGDPYRELYFGIYVRSPWATTNLDAFLNHTQVGAKVDFNVQREAFQLPVLYALPDWDTAPADIEASTAADVAGFTTLDPLNNRPLHGALGGYRYRLKDVAGNDEHIVSREWLFYRLNGGGGLMATLPGQGDRGEICEFEAEDVIHILDNGNWPVMLVVCRRIDDRGMVSIENYNLAQLGDDTFQYKVAFNLAEYSDIDLYVGVSDTQGGPGTDPVAVSDPNFAVFNPSYLYLMPYNFQLDNYTGTKKYQVRYTLANETEFTTGDWLDVDYSNTVNGVWLPFFTEIDATQSSYYPISVWWRFQTEYGTSPWTVTPAEIRLFSQPQAPPLAVDWTDLPAALLPDETFSVGVNASRPDTTYSGKFSLWLYNPDDLTQHVKLETTGGTSCFGYGGWDSNSIFPEFKVPDDVSNWNLGENGRLAVKLKFAWVKTGDIGLIDCVASGQPNPLSDFYTLLNPLLQDDFYAARTSEASSVVVTEPGDFTVQLDEASPRIYDPSGDVNFAFYLERSGEASPVKLEWRWSRSGDDYWEDGEWNGGGEYQEVWPGSGDAFAGRWRWNTASGLVEAAQRGVSTADLPFAPLDSENLLDNFFDGQLEVSATVEMRMTFDDGEMLVQEVPVLLQPEANDTLVLGLSTKREGQVVGHSHARFPDLPDLEWTIPTLSQIVGSIRVAFFKRDETFPSGWETLFCEVLDEDLALSSGSNYFTSFNTATVAGQGLTYTLTAAASCGLYNLIDTEGAGEYQLRVSSQTCGGNWQQAFASRLTVNPSTGFTLRFHHRDHLGSSAVSRAYSPGFDEVVAGAEPFYLKMADGSMTLYAKPAKATLFDPYGEALGSVAGEPKPRYTDHEYDEASGLNYMKGRYQLANYAKFNRPDPMRDWDWENPHSINLYEYVRNNPIMANDPDGYMTAALVKGVTAIGAAIGGSLILGHPNTKEALINSIKTYWRELRTRPPGLEVDDSLKRLFKDSQNGPSNNGEKTLPPGGGAVDQELQEWVPRVYDDGEFEVEGLVSTGGDDSGEVKNDGSLPKPPTGPGAVPKSERDPKRFFTPAEREAKRAEQGGKCANGCGSKIDASNSAGHHIKRHADGGRTVPENHAEVCNDCHKKLHSKE